MVLFRNNKHLLIRDREPGKGVRLVKRTHESVGLTGAWDFYFNEHITYGAQRATKVISAN